MKRELKLDKLRGAVSGLVTAPMRIPLMANGTIDLECGNTTNNVERQQQVWYTNTHFLTAESFRPRRSRSKIETVNDLKGKTVIAPASSTNIKQALELSSRLNLAMTVIPAQDQGEAFLMVETGRADAFVRDDIVLASPDRQREGSQGLRDLGGRILRSLNRAYGISLRADDATFKAVADAATSAALPKPRRRSALRQVVPCNRSRRRVPI